MVAGMDGLAVADAVVVAQGVSGVVAGTSMGHMMNPGHLEIEVLQGSDLVIKDRGFMRSNKSDPFCKVVLDGAKVGKTPVIKRDLNPKWRWRTTARVARGAQKRLVVKCFDSDVGSADDPMGEVTIEVLELLRGCEVGTRICNWYDVKNCEGCDNAKGQLEIAFTWKPRTIVKLDKGTTFEVNPQAYDTVFVGLGWTGACGAKVGPFFVN